MFKKNVVSPKTEVSLVEPSKVCVMVTPEEEGAIERYKIVSNKIDFNPAALIEVSLRSYLSKKLGYIYNYAEVRDFLHVKYGHILKLDDKDKPGWEWYALTDNDRITGRAKDLRDSLFSITREWVNSGNITYDSYQHLVPVEVLEMVQDMKKNVPGLTYWVSDLARVHPRPDPFLMVYCKGFSAPVVIAHWDEPGFVGDKKN
jgi:hypothetical protein